MVLLRVAGCLDRYDLLLVVLRLALGRNRAAVHAGQSADHQEEREAPGEPGGHGSGGDRVTERSELGRGSDEQPEQQAGSRDLDRPHDQVELRPPQAQEVSLFLTELVLVDGHHGDNQARAQRDASAEKC